MGINDESTNTPISSCSCSCSISLNQLLMRNRELEEKLKNEAVARVAAERFVLKYYNKRIEAGLWEINDTIRRRYSNDDVNTANRAKGQLIDIVEEPWDSNNIQQAINVAQSRIQSCLYECNDTIRRYYSNDDYNTATRIKNALRE